MSEDGGSAVKRTESGRVDDANNGACDTAIWGCLCIGIPAAVMYGLSCKWCPGASGDDDEDQSE
jgi:hypothetical protein